MDIHILLFYKFQPIAELEYFARRQRKFCNELGVMGKILVAKEGINGSISGTKEQIEKYKRFLWASKGFEDVFFKEEIGLEHPFTKMIVRIKNEIVALKKEVDISKTGKYLKPEEFLEMYENNEDVIVLDVRNAYEYKLGRFKNAVNPNIRTFRQFPEFVGKFKEHKDRKIVMYCTGGIRCEKASAYMKEQGFENVYQLEGGIINFCQKLPNTVWEGKCFVFDKRLMSDLNQNNQPITNCIICRKRSDLYRNCKNVDCDALVIMCNECQEKFHGCCSKECWNDFQDYSRKRSENKKLIRLIH
jgi:UPF0176 protein